MVSTEVPPTIQTFAPFFRVRFSSFCTAVDSPVVELSSTGPCRLPASAVAVGASAGSSWLSSTADLASSRPAWLWPTVFRLQREEPTTVPFASAPQTRAVVFLRTGSQLGLLPSQAVGTGVNAPVVRSTYSVLCASLEQQSAEGYEAHSRALASSSSRSRSLRARPAARSNSVRASAVRPRRASRSARTLGSRW